MISVLIASCSAPPLLEYYGHSTAFFEDTSLVALYIPTRAISVTCRTRGKPPSDSLTADSFFVDAFNGLMAYEISRRFRISHYSGQMTNQLNEIRCSLGSHMDRSRSSAENIESEIISKMAMKHQADLVVIPYSCRILQKSVKPRGWRKGKYGPYYEKPVSYVVQSIFHLQLWDSRGRLIYERIGRGDTKRPVNFTILTNPAGAAESTYSPRRFYAPPVVQTMHQAIKATFEVRG